jgi:outer membrane lipoprotein-sorting protein
MKKIIIIIFLLLVTAGAQTKDPYAILNNVKKASERVKDYQADVKIKLDISFIKVPDSEAKIYYKAPDKMHIESKTFALLPKEGMDFSPAAFLKGSYTAIYVKEDVTDGVKASVVKIIPSDEKSNVILSTLWIDQHTNTIRRVETTAKVNGTFVIELKYDGKNGYNLPSSLVFTFNADRIRLPKSFNSNNSETSKSKETGSRQGKVYIKYNNYVVNKGISDNIFEKKK